MPSVSPIVATRPLLDARDVEVVLDGTAILKGASLQVREGEVHVLIGPNGAGKTTFANVVTGHVPLAAGAIELRGDSLGGPVAARVRSGIGRKFQVPRVFPRLSVNANVTVARRAPAHRAGPSPARGALAVSALTVDRGRLSAVRGVAFDVPAGGSLGVLGTERAG